MAVTVRRLTASDGMALRGVLLDALRDAPTAFGGDLKQEEERPLSFWHEFAEGVVKQPKHLFLLAYFEHDAEPCGMARGSLDQDEAPTLVEVGGMWTRPSQRRNGVGRALLNAIRDWAQEKKVDTLALWVTEGNNSAIPMYEREGFSLTGERKPHPNLGEYQILRMRQDLA